MTIVWFQDLNSEDIYLVGGKGANLGKMAQAGFPVPPGFCISTEAYKQFIAENSIWPQIEHLLSTLPSREAGEKIRQTIEKAPMPESISKCIKEAYAELDGGQMLVAVRSSATAEDLADASFAGQQESYLGIRGTESLISHVQRCWASLWTERAISYRERQSFSHQEVSLSVLVQKMLASDVAGVLFTVNPVTRQDNEMLVNASYGLGESVVSGRVTPDTYRIARRRFRVLEQSCGTKETRIDINLTSGGTLESSLSKTEREQFCLDLLILRRLTTLGERVEKHYGSPQDIEWALVNQELYLLQTRPVTGLTTKIPNSKTLSRIQQAILNDILEHYPEPPYPLDYFAVTDSYQQLTNSLCTYGIVFPPSHEIILLDEEGIPTITPPNLRINPHIFKILGMVFHHLKINPNVWINQQQLNFSTELSTLNKIDIRRLNHQELAQFIQKAVDITSRVGRIRFRDIIIPAIFRSIGLKWLMIFSRDYKNISVMDLLKNLPYKTALIDRDLKKIALEADQLPQAREILLTSPLDLLLSKLQNNTEGNIFLEKVKHFLNQHGARTMKMYLPFSNRSWSEDPVTLLTMIIVLLRSNKVHTESQENFHEIHQQILEQLPGCLHRRFISATECYRIGHIARESTLYTIEEGFLQARRGVDEAVQRLLNDGALLKSDQIIYLTLTELYSILNGSLSSTEARQRILCREKARFKAASTWQRQWRIAKKPTDDKHIVKGLSGSSGYAEGTVKVIRGPEEFDKLQPGDVLVCPYTDPAWTPLFTLACAVVSDTGGPLSHAAIVAREYAIPAVLGTQIATSQFKDGDLIHVDGQRGEVRKQE